MRKKAARQSPVSSKGRVFSPASKLARAGLARVNSSGRLELTEAGRARLLAARRAR